MAVPETLRPDFSRSLIHLTRQRPEPKLSNMHNAVPAFDVLKEILTSGKIKGSTNAGFVKGPTPAVCFSEIPLSAVKYFAAKAGENTPEKRYNFYGVALSKRTAFEIGGRPVNYLPDNEAGWIPEGERWRHVRFVDGHIDFTHEREWRVPVEVDLKGLGEGRGFYVLVWSKAEAIELEKLNLPLKPSILGIMAMEHLVMML